MRAEEWGTLELSLIAQKAEICIWQMESKHPAKLLSLVLNKLQNIPSLTVQIHTGNSNTGAGKIPFGQGHLLQQPPEALNINYSKHKYSCLWRLLLTPNTDPTHRGLFSPQRERFKPCFPKARFVQLSLTLFGSWNESSPVVRGEKHKGVLTDPQLLEVLQDFPNAVIDFPHSIPIPEAKGDAKHSKQQKKKRVSTTCPVDLICTCAAEIPLMHQVFCCHCKLFCLWPAESSPSGVLRVRVCSGVSHSWTEEFSHKIHKQRQTHLARDWEVITWLSLCLETLWSNTPSVYGALCLLQTAFSGVLFCLLLWFIGF